MTLLMFLTYPLLFLSARYHVPALPSSWIPGSNLIAVKDIFECSDVSSAGTSEKTYGHEGFCGLGLLIRWRGIVPSFKAGGGFAWLTRHLVLSCRRHGLSHKWKRDGKAGRLIACKTSKRPGSRGTERRVAAPLATRPRVTHNPSHGRVVSHVTLHVNDCRHASLACTHGFCHIHSGPSNVSPIAAALSIMPIGLNCSTCPWVVSSTCHGQ